MSTQKSGAETYTNTFNENPVLNPLQNQSIITSLEEEVARVYKETENVEYDKYLSLMTKNVNMSALSSIEGLPYQFLPSVDRRIKKRKSNTSNINTVGRKYIEKIVNRMPLLFLMPCTAKFMADANDNVASAVLSGTLASIKNTIEGDAFNAIANLLGSSYDSEKSARYYGTEFAYAGYYNYLQVMLSTLAHYLGIEDRYVYYRGDKVKIGDIDWALQNQGVDDFAHYLSGCESIVYYMDGIDSVSETFSNETTMPSIASEFNNKGDEARQMRFLFGNKADKAATILGIKTVIERAGGAVGGVITGDLSGLADIMEFASDYLNSSMFQDLLAQSPNTILQGGRLIFPEIWSDSSYSKNYNISIKLRSPDHDSVSIFMNIFVPYCKLLALTLPHTDASVNTSGNEEDTNSYMNPNTYFAPYIVKAYSPGTINIDMGIIDSLSATKGATCQWNADGLPTQLDIDVSIKDLYSAMAMSGWGQNTLKLNIGRIWAAVSNTAYMDFLANMAGLNVKDTHKRKVELAARMELVRIKNTGARIVTNFSNKMSDYMKRFYDW